MRPSRLARAIDPNAPLLGEDRRNRLVDAVNRMAIPSDARLVTDVTFTAGSSANVAHGLGRAPKGFVASNARTSAPSLYRTLQSAELELVYLRLTHSGAGTTLVDLVVW